MCLCLGFEVPLGEPTWPRGPITKLHNVTGRRTPKATLPMGACCPQGTTELPGANNDDRRLNATPSALGSALFLFSEPLVSFSGTPGLWKSQEASP